jgi:hypothetical protein
MTTPERLGDRMLDLMVFAPIGLALEAKELLPKLADRGRGQVALARLAGKVATRSAPGGAGQVIDGVRGVVKSALGLHDDPSSPMHEAESESQVVDVQLPIDGYQAMTAMELLEHLEPLSDDDLAEVLAFEQAHRARATVINRIRQLRD